MRHLIAVLLLILPGFTNAEPLKTSLGTVRVDRMATDLVEPWGLAFLPDGGFLVTLRGGELRHYDPTGGFSVVSGVPQVVARGQGGLLDVASARDFSTSRTLFISYAKPVGTGAATALARAHLSLDGTRLEGLRELFVMNRATISKHHFGGRIVEARDGTLFLTLGERGEQDEAQNPATHNGSIVRLHRDGKPLLNAQDLNGLPELWSIGHRNPQGAALDRSGKLWVAEHGAKGGDEINSIRQGANYGWPIISYGRHYSGLKIGEGTHKTGMEQPEFYWDPSIAPSGLMIYSGKMWPQWTGHFFVGSLKFDMISRLALQSGALVEVERISGNQTGRVRDIREAPDGSIWFLSVDNGAVYRLSK